MIQYVCAIERCPAQHVVKVTIPHPGGQFVCAKGYSPWEKLSIVGLASLEVSDSPTDDGTKVCTTKLSAVLASRPIPDPRPMCYRITLTDGERIIIGLGPFPKSYPVATFVDSHPDRPAERCACTMNVTWVNVARPVIIRDGLTRSWILQGTSARPKSFHV